MAYGPITPSTCIWLIMDIVSCENDRHARQATAHGFPLFGPIDDAAAPFANPFDEGIMADLIAGLFGGRKVQVAHRQDGRVGQRFRVEEMAGRFVGTEELLHALPKSHIGTTRLRQILGPFLGGRQIEDGAKELLQLVEIEIEIFAHDLSGQ
jgi:hypothetical protein